MKQIYKVLAAAALVVGATSCNNFLEPDPKGQLVTENFFQTEADLTMAVNALYYNVAFAQTNSNPTIPQCQGDDMTSTVGSNKSAYLSADAFEEPSDYKGVEALWLYQYRIIQAANLIIDNADRVDASQETINIAKGNAMFWRACAYFQLVRIYGPLPVNLHNVADNNDTPLTDVKGIYDLICSDLETADGYNLPTSYEKYQYGYSGGCNYWVTQQTVKAALAAVYMNMAGYPLELGADQYKKAADKAKEVVDGVKDGKYDLALESDWNQVYSCGNNWSKEQLITISYYTVPGQMGDMGQYTSQFCKCHRFGQLGNGWSDFVPEYRWWANFPEGPRKDAIYDPLLNIYARDDNGNDICVSWWATNDKLMPADDSKNVIIGVFHPQFAPFTINADEAGAPLEEPHDYRKRAYDGQSYPQNHRFIRYSEVLCWFAESAARAGVYQAEALAALQQVQARAYATGVTPDNSDIAEAAYLEHGYEVTGYPLALVTRRADQFRMNRFKEAWEYRHGAQDEVLVPAGTTTHTYGRVNTAASGRPVYKNLPITYQLPADLKVAEPQPVASEWRGEKSIYHPYPPTEVEKNPNLVR